MSVVQGATWCLSRMLFFIMSASCYRIAGHGGDSFVDTDTELPPQPRPAEVLSGRHGSGVPLPTLVPRLDIETHLATDGQCR